MRHSIPHIKIESDNLPECPKCGAKTTFTHLADMGRDGKVYFIFRCDVCDAGEMKIWRPEWQSLADTIAADDL